MTFGTPWALALIVLVPLLVWWSGRRRARAVVVYSSLGLVVPLGRTWRQRLRWLPVAMLALGMIALIIALARPRYGVGEVRTTANGSALLMVVDRSASMGLPFEFQGQMGRRIDAVKVVFKEFIEGNGRDLAGRPEDLIGLVAFARFADTICPLVRIHETLVQLVEKMELADQRWEGGTAIGDGLALGATRLKKAEEDLLAREKNPQDPEFTIKSKAIVLLTDGDENVGDVDARSASEMCEEWGIKIYAIGIGDDRGGFIETPAGRLAVPRGGGFDEQLMKDITTKTGGRYWRADTGEALRRIYAEIDALEKTEIKSKEFTSYRESFAPWAAAGAGLLAASMFLSATIFRRSP
jgi:Ca-activated chloride channel family protein